MLVGIPLVVAVVAATVLAFVLAGGNESDDEVLAASGSSTTATTAEPSTTAEVTSTVEERDAVTANPELPPGPMLAVGEVPLDKTQLAAGMCINDSADDTSDQAGVITVADCAAPHTAEVFSVSALPYAPQAAFPGDGAVAREADAQCDATFEPYVGTAYLDSSLEYGYYYPDNATWEKYEDRIVVCFLLDPDGARLTGAMKGSAT